MYKVGKCRLQEFLDASGMTQTDLAHKVNVSRQQVSRFANNRRIMSYEVAKNISSLLNCEMDELYEFLEVDNKE